MAGASALVIGGGPHPGSTRTQTSDFQWPKGDAASAGFPTGFVDDLDGVVDAFPAVTGIVVVRDGAIIAETYRGRYGPNEPVNVRSVTKSVVGTLVGIARQRDVLPGLDLTIGEAIPDRIPDGADPAVADVSIYHLLTMTSGLAWEYGSDYATLRASDDPVRTTLSQPIVTPPGEVYVYNSGGSHLLGIILAELTGQPLEEIAAEWLFDPLGIVVDEWWRSPQDEVIGGYGIHLQPRDMAKLGLLYLQAGVWNDDRLLSSAWIDAATSVRSAGDGTGGTPYGYQWWVTTVRGHDAYFALGYGGQYIYVVPDLGLIAVIAVGFDAQPVELRSPRPIVEDLIVPAIG